MKRHAYGNTVSKDLWTALDEAVAESGRATQQSMEGMSVATVMDRYCNTHVNNYYYKDLGVTPWVKPVEVILRWFYVGW